MHVPKQFEETDSGVLHALIESAPLGAWIIHADGEIVANHIPFLLERDRGEYGTLVGHVARANPAWRQASAAASSLVIFQGPQAYITPSFYPSKAEHGKVVPTWNYAVVHAHGPARIIDDRDWLHRHVSEQSAIRERDRAQPWQVSDAPAPFIDAMLNAIVGLEIPIERLIGKWKVSQNRPMKDRLGVIEGLGATQASSARAMAQLVDARAQRVSADE